MKRALILMYHVIDEPRSAQEARFCVRPAEFARQMRWLRSSGASLVGLDEIVDCVEARRALPEDAVTVTFDDGFADIATQALPVLAEHRIPATLFAVSGLIGGTNEWMHRRGFPERKLVSIDQLRELARAGIAIGSHTVSHPRLPEIALDEVAREVRASREQLEDVLGAPVRHFAYPYGLYDDGVSRAVEAAGYRSACSTRSGFNRSDEDRFGLRRIDVFGGDALWQFRQKLRYGTNHASRLYPLRYYAGRIAARLAS